MVGFRPPWAAPPRGPLPSPRTPTPAENGGGLAGMTLLVLMCKKRGGKV